MTPSAAVATALVLAVLSTSADRIVAQGGLRLMYLGAAGWEITDGKIVILVDPYLTRAKYGTPIDAVSPSDERPTVGNSTIVPSDTAVIDKHITRADLILVTHTHPDHSLDVPYIARRTGATVVGTESTTNLARASGVPEPQLKPVSGREDLKFAGVSVRVIPSLHGIFRRPANPAAAPPRPPVFPADAKPPFQYAQHVEGGTLAYLIRIGTHQIVVFGSMNFIEAEIDGLRPDIALIGAMPERANIGGYTLRIMRALGHPRLVLPTHWDQFNVPLGFSQQHARDRLQSFVDEVKAASPSTRVIVPEHLQPIFVDRLTDQPRGSIAGRVVDLDGGALPGTTVVARGPAMARSVVASGNDGRFQIADLEPGPYRVHAELSGLTTETAERVDVGSGRTAECSFALRFGDGVVVYHTLADARWPVILEAADVVARFRITRVIGPGAPIRDMAFTTEYEGRATRIVKGSLRGGAGAPFSFTLAQPGAWGAGCPRAGVGDAGHRAGDELIGFFHRETSGRLISVENDAFLFPIVNGTISWRREQPRGVRNGMTVDAFLALLRR